MGCSYATSAAGGRANWAAITVTRDPGFMCPVSMGREGVECVGSRSLVHVSAECCVTVWLFMFSPARATAAEVFCAYMRRVKTCV